MRYLNLIIENGEIVDAYTKGIPDDFAVILEENGQFSRLLMKERPDLVDFALEQEEINKSRHYSF